VPNLRADPQDANAATPRDGCDARAWSTIRSTSTITNAMSRTDHRMLRLT
jgi:hypothetical protein